MDKKMKSHDMDMNAYVVKRAMVMPGMGKDMVMSILSTRETGQYKNTPKIVPPKQHGGMKGMGGM